MRENRKVKGNRKYKWREEIEKQKESRYFILQMFLCNFWPKHLITVTEIFFFSNEPRSIKLSVLLPLQILCYNYYPNLKGRFTKKQSVKHYRKMENEAQPYMLKGWKKM